MERQVIWAQAAQEDLEREIFIFNYRLIYRIEEDWIYILALIHGRRDFRDAWKEKVRL